MFFVTSSTCFFVTCVYNIDTPGMLWKFVFGGVPILFGLPFIFVTGASLYSKLLHMQVQGETLLISIKHNQ